MKVFSGKGSFPPLDRKPLLAVGNFDGVHLGHQKIFRETISRAADLGFSSALLTFSGHPLRTLRPGQAPGPLMHTEDRLKIAETFGFETAYVLDFDEALAAMTPDAFMRGILLEALRAAGIVAGTGWRFGKGREGDMKFLASLGRDLGFAVAAVDPVMAGGAPVSSTRIRDFLAAGEVTMASEFLGRPHFIRGKVERGRGLGKGLGFPTVNLDAGPLLIPADGIYGGAYIHSGRVGPAAVNIGRSPTFPDGAARVEAHLDGWEGDLYGKTVTIAFLRRLRSQRPFADGEALSRQIALDVKAASKLFSPDVIKEVPR